MPETKVAMLDAGVRLFSAQAGELLKGLTAGTVAQEAGFHRQTSYRYRDTHAEYVQDLVRHLMAPPVALLLGLVVQTKAAADDAHGAEIFETGAIALLTSLTQPRSAQPQA